MSEHPTKTIPAQELKPGSVFVDWQTIDHTVDQVATSENPRDDDPVIIRVRCAGEKAVWYFNAGDKVTVRADGPVIYRCAAHAPEGAKRVPSDDGERVPCSHGDCGQPARPYLMPPASDDEMRGL